MRQTNEHSIKHYLANHQLIFKQTAGFNTDKVENKKKGRQFFSTKGSSRIFNIYFSKRAYEHGKRKQLITGQRNFRIISAFPSHKVMPLGPDSKLISGIFAFSITPISWTCPPRLLQTLRFVKLKKQNCFTFNSGNYDWAQATPLSVPGMKNGLRWWTLLKTWSVHGSLCLWFQWLWLRTQEQHGK